MVLDFKLYKVLCFYPRINKVLIIKIRFFGVIEEMGKRGQTEIISNVKVKTNQSTKLITQVQ